ncbi:MAG: O-antigen ligase family protein [Alphaproteobacteria bacterium]|nr:O-antigen ligase family protein [Alphaproteobacteria bacterium]MBV8406089.1 O-antigen ligase family protein [Alphaproteobacteria bacterium]
MAGMFITCPIPLPGLGEDGTGPRTTDLLNFASAGLLVVALFRSTRLNRAIYGVVLVWALSVPWVFMEIYGLSGATDPAVQRVLVRWLLCACAAYWITVATENPMLRSRFLYGLLIGVVPSLLTVTYDFLTFSPEDVPIDELVLLAIYNGKDIHDFAYRAYGFFGHPNAAAGCMLLGVPVLIGAVAEGRLPRWSILIAVALMGSVFYLTKSRGPLIVSTALVAYWLWSQGRGPRLLLVVTALATALVTLAAGQFATEWAGGVLLDRFVDTESISDNADGRWWTIATSLEMVLQNPLGMGSAYVEPLEIATGTNATHNAYLELGLMGGVPLMVLIVIRLLNAATGLFMPLQRAEAWVASYLLGVFAFETYFLLLNIQLVTVWLVVSPLRPLSKQAPVAIARPMHRVRGQVVARTPEDQPG